MPARSQNGWLANRRDLCQTYQVPGSKVKVYLQGEDVGFVLTRVMAFVDQHVEDIDTRAGVKGFDVPDDWSYAERPIRDSRTTSNHASGTAVDVNAVQHPLAVRNTWTAAEERAINAHLQEYRDPVTGKVVIRWGENYLSRVDGMHFEIVGTPAEVKRVADRLRAQDKEDDDMQLDDKVKLTRKARELLGKDEATVAELLQGWNGGTRAARDEIERLRKEQTARDGALLAAVQALGRGGNLTQAQLTQAAEDGAARALAQLGQALTDSDPA